MHQVRTSFIICRFCETRARCIITSILFPVSQDSQYVHQVPQEEVPPYVSVWCALDDVSEENGCLYILPYPALPDPSATPPRTNVDHTRFSSPDEMRRHHLAMANAYNPNLLGGTHLSTCVQALSRTG
jgi:ectoine hydroxylase-related dioxygenase (phytanoyl-CoA dioxygenase family)